ncbi:MAG: alpha/beta hydrolase [Xanthobacteraceae bacterium]|nr:alpha/beta hydrolase [Xanthobacteraceae bacterium]
MTALDLEAEYNNRARVPEHPGIIAGWKESAAAFRASHRDAELGIAYGPSARQTLDIFWPGSSRDAPLALFIHGGYWQALDPSHFSHLAQSANANGVVLALCGYDLCPQVRLAEIIGQVRASALFLWKRYGRKIVASGHSAGGHLTACLLATDWKRYDANTPEDLVPSGLSISGLFDLTPLVPTTVNNALKLDHAEAARNSPLSWPLPDKRTLDAWVGGAESSEYLRQSRTVTDEWRARGAETAYREIKGANHFTVLDPLNDPRSEISLRFAALSHALR